MRNQFGILERKVDNYSHSLVGTVGILAHYSALDSPNHFSVKVQKANSHATACRSVLISLSIVVSMSWHFLRGATWLAIQTRPAKTFLCFQNSSPNWRLKRFCGIIVCSMQSEPWASRLKLLNAPEPLYLRRQLTLAAHSQIHAHAGSPPTFACDTAI